MDALFGAKEGEVLSVFAALVSKTSAFLVMLDIGACVHRPWPMLLTLNTNLGFLIRNVSPSYEHIQASRSKLSTKSCAVHPRLATTRSTVAVLQ